MMNHERAQKRSLSEDGAVAVEFAVVSILVLMLLVALVGFAQVLQVRIAVTHAAREGARMAAVNKPYLAYVQAQAAQGGVAPSAVLVTPSSPTKTHDPATDTYFVTVSVSAPVDLSLLGVDWVMRQQSTTVSSTATMRAEW